MSEELTFTTGVKVKPHTAYPALYEQELIPSTPIPSGQQMTAKNQIL